MAVGEPLWGRAAQGIRAAELWGLAPQYIRSEEGRGAPQMGVPGQGRERPRGPLSPAQDLRPPGDVLTLFVSDTGPTDELAKDHCIIGMGAHPCTQV
jgi:hypothetical protein